MSAVLRFEKLEGIGNDFVVLDTANLPDNGLPTEVLVRLCDRHYGIGADGVLLCTWLGAQRIRMDVVNANGSVAEMCGNGLRSVAAWASRQADIDTVVIQTLAGPFECAIRRHGDEAVVVAPVGHVTLSAIAAGVLGPYLPAEGLPLSLAAKGRTFDLWPASTGNPHAVHVVAENVEPDELLEMARRFGPDLSGHPAFRAGANIGFGQVGSGSLYLAVYERGSGATLACGTGACAAFAVFTRIGLLEPGTPTDVVLPGGVLSLQLDAAEAVGDLSGPITMSGPARRVFTGQIPASSALLAPCAEPSPMS